MRQSRLNLIPVNDRRMREAMNQVLTHRAELWHELGLRSWSGAPSLMEHSHRHNDLELNFVVRGSMSYVFGGQRLVVSAGQLVLFWAAMPHQLIELMPDSFVHWVTLPLGWFVKQDFPATLAAPILNGVPILADAQPSDTTLLKQWDDDLPNIFDTRPIDDETNRIVLLELEARLRRFGQQQLLQPAPRPPTKSVHKGEAMARWVAAHFAEEIQIGHIARAVNLHPNYAMSLFRKTFGVSLVDYVTQHRVAHAQQLLISTDLSVLDVAMRAGFGSSSQFYAAFKRICGVSPRRYRERLG